MNIALFILFVMIQIADGWTTIQCIESGKGNEANPIVAWGIKKIGLKNALIIYKALAIAIGYLLIDYPIALVLLCLFYAYVVYNNYKILKG
jgi:hypothetical protein